MNHVFKYSLLLLFLHQSFCVFPQIVINEVCSHNTSDTTDEENKYEDWIELYNSGAAPVNLNGYRIADQTPDPSVWNLPDITLDPGSHFVLFASEKNRKVKIHHWETAVKETDTWKYTAPANDPPANWKQTGFNDATWMSGTGMIGYGDGDDVTILPNGTIAVFMRKAFAVADTSKLLQAILHIDYDDAFVAYLNGVEVARANIKNITPSRWDQAEAEREALVYKGGKYEKYTIQKEMLKNTLVNGVNILAVQCHNQSIVGTKEDMTIRTFLSFGMKDSGSQFSPTPSWFNEPLQAFHTNFKLSNSGSEKLRLISPAATLIDMITIPEMRANNSYGRYPDGSSAWNVYINPTPGFINPSGYSGYCNDTITFSVEGGFYPSSQTLTLGGASEIHYTLDGTDPTYSSPLYTAPLTISSTTVVKAACFSNTLAAPGVYTKTYFINENIDLPVFSISVNPDDFFNPQTGIYVLGPDADSSNMPNYGANFWFDWERPVHIEFFDKQKYKCFEVDADARIFGNYSRWLPMKSLAIIMSNKYDAPEINYQLFPYKNITTFKSFVLRNSGGDFNTTHFLDGLIQMRAFGKTALDIQAYRPSVVFINGQYWGIHNIREKLNENYVEANSGVDADKVDLLDSWAKQIEGDNNIYYLWWNAVNNNMSIPSNFNMIADSFDLDNMIDYFATEIYISNWDWPVNNIKAWRPQTGSRKYRYILWDTDLSLGLFNLQDASLNQLGRVKNSVNLDMGPHAEIFFSLTKNIAFRNRFINRSADLMNTIFTPADFSQLLYRLRDSIANEMPRHLARWGTTETYWNGQINGRIDFINARPAAARSQMVSEFNLVKQVDVTLNVMPAGAGIIKMNTIYPDTYPWTGVYFDGVPVTITAIPNPGYTFSEWKAPVLIPSGNPNKSITLNVNLNETFTAYFTGAAAPLDLKISEINYHSEPAKESGDWFEILNNGTSPVDISNWTFSDFNDYNKYVFPSNTVIPAQGRLVVCNDPVKFKNVYPSVTNFTGPFDFNLSNSGDMLRLYDYQGDCYISLSYSDALPWDESADGKGYTLELIDPLSDEKLPGSWSSFCKYGSPGLPFGNCVLNTMTELTEENLVSLYPNPTNGQFFMEIKNSAYDLISCTITDQIGQVIYSRSYDNSSPSMSIDFTDVLEGVYYLKIITENGTYLKKIIKLNK